MSFGIIVCPHCKKAKAIKINVKTTRCPRCNKVLNVKKLRILYKTNSHEKLRNAMGLINADLDGRYENFKQKIEKTKKEKV